MASRELFSELKSKLSNIDAIEGLAWISSAFGNAAKFSTSLGLEDQIVTSWISNYAPAIEIFTLDTGRLFQETYDILEETKRQYKHPIKAYFPKAEKVEALITAKGPNSFYESVDNRKECCGIRKVEPLSRALDGAVVWITGIRADQSDNRSGMETVEWDEQRQLIKYNPVLNWTLADVETYIQEHKIPVNTLHKKNFPSIGCAPCTRAVMPNENPRAGRWWWESSAKECGLHDSKSH